MNTKLYVGNIPWDVTDEQLEKHFLEAGEVVSVAIIRDRETERSKGFGFVEMMDETGAKKAIEMFDEKDFEGRKIYVKEARPKKPREF